MSETVYETGWHVLPEFQGRGIATTAVTMLLKQAAARPGLRPMHAYPAVDNEPSNDWVFRFAILLRYGCPDTHGATRMTWADSTPRVRCRALEAGLPRSASWH